MKIKIFVGSRRAEIEDEVNAFIADNKVTMNTLHFAHDNGLYYIILEYYKNCLPNDFYSKLP